MTYKRMTNRRRQLERRGFTMLEIVLVIAVLLGIAGLAWPLLFEPLADQRLRSAAEHVRAEWQSARASAMTTGQIHLFRYEPNSGTYQVTLWSGLGTTEGSAGTAGLGGELGGNAKSLPTHVTFADARLTADQRSNLVTAEMSQQGTAATSAPPVMFYADGSTTTAELRVANEYGRYIDIAVRGLTGVTKIGPICDGEAQP